MKLFKKKVVAEAEVAVDNSVQEAIETRKALVQFYQQGFLDGFRKGKKSKLSERVLWVSCYKECQRCFNKRYMKKILNNVSNIQKEQELKNG